MAISRIRKECNPCNRGVPRIRAKGVVLAHFDLPLKRKTRKDAISKSAARVVLSRLAKRLFLEGGVLLNQNQFVVAHEHFGFLFWEQYSTKNPVWYFVQCTGSSLNNLELERT